MSRNVLDLYLTKVSTGDLSYIIKLAERLSDRLLFMPAIERPVPGGLTQFVVYQMERDDRMVVPVFTAENKFKTWLKEAPEGLKKISMSGADLCSTMTGSVGLLINEGDKHVVEFSPESVALVGAKLPPLSIPAWEPQVEASESPDGTDSGLMAVAGKKIPIEEVELPNTPFPTADENRLTNSVRASDWAIPEGGSNPSLVIELPPPPQEEPRIVAARATDEPIKLTQILDETQIIETDIPPTQKVDLLSVAAGTHSRSDETEAEIEGEDEVTNSDDSESTARSWFGIFKG